MHCQNCFCTSRYCFWKAEERKASGGAGEAEMERKKQELGGWYRQNCPCVSSYHGCKAGKWTAGRAVREAARLENGRPAGRRTKLRRNTSSRGRPGRAAGTAAAPQCIHRRCKAEKWEAHGDVQALGKGAVAPPTFHCASSYQHRKADKWVASREVCEAEEKREDQERAEKYRQTAAVPPAIVAARPRNGRPAGRRPKLRWNARGRRAKLRRLLLLQRLPQRRPKRTDGVDHVLTHTDCCLK